MKKIKKDNKLLAIIISRNFNQKGIHFFTPQELSQQVAFMRHPAGKIIWPHFHNPLPREVIYTQEVLFIKRGKLRVDFYTDQLKYIESHILFAGDTLLLIKGAHGFEVLEEIEMLEVKQGPYIDDQDKTRFVGVKPEKLIIVE